METHRNNKEGVDEHEEPELAHNLGRSQPSRYIWNLAGKTFSKKFRRSGSPLQKFAKNLKLSYSK